MSREQDLQQLQAMNDELKMVEAATWRRNEDLKKISDLQNQIADSGNLQFEPEDADNYEDLLEEFSDTWYNNHASPSKATTVMLLINILLVGIPAILMGADILFKTGFIIPVTKLAEVANNMPLAVAGVICQVLLFVLIVCSPKLIKE